MLRGLVDVCTATRRQLVIASEERPQVSDRDSSVLHDLDVEVHSSSTFRCQGLHVGHQIHMFMPDPGSSPHRLRMRAQTVADLVHRVKNVHSGRLLVNSCWIVRAVVNPD